MISPDLAETVKRLERERDEANALAERLKLEAQIHAQEARTANATISEIYQACSGGTGEPGNWHGAEPVRAKIASLESSLAEARKGARTEGVLTLSADEFDELERCMTEPREPTEAMKRAAEMHAKFRVRLKPTAPQETAEKEGE